jgi:hypothetical protein
LGLYTAYANTYTDAYTDAKPSAKPAYTNRTHTDPTYASTISHSTTSFSKPNATH